MATYNSPLQDFLHWEKTCPEKDFLRQYFNGNLEVLSYAKSGDQIRRVARAIVDKKLPPKSKIALMSNNCAHWIMIDLAIMMSGHVSVPIYPSLHADSIKLILQHSESKMLFAGKLDNYEDKKNGFLNIPVIGVEKYGIPSTESWESMVDQNERLENISFNDPKDLITIIYTSGTTGHPKGVMHSIANFSNGARNLFHDLKVPDHPRFFSYLPLAHIAERIGLENGTILNGGSVTFPESLQTFASNLEDTQPDLFFAVPRIWAKFQ